MVAYRNIRCHEKGTRGDTALYFELRVQTYGNTSFLTKEGCAFYNTVL